MKKFLIFGLMALLVPAFAQAAAFEGGESYTFPASRTVQNNLYAGGGNSNFMGTVAGDLFLFSGTLNFSGTVGQDLTAAGGNVNITGRVGQDLRVAGGNLNISGPIGGELLAGAGQLYLDRAAQVAGDARLAGGNINIAGTIGGNATIYGGTVQIDGRIQGNVKVKTDQKLVIGSGAVINGTLNYSAPQEATIEQGAKITGGVNYEKYQPNQYGQKNKAGKGFWGLIWAGWLFRLVALLVAALVVYFLARKKTDEAAKYVLANFGKETLRGFIFLILFPIAVIISFITVIGVWLGILGLLFYLCLVVLAPIFAAILIGALLFRLAFKKNGFGADWKSVSLGAIIVSLIQLIPIAGWIFNFIFFLAGLGGVFYLFYDSFRRK